MREEFDATLVIDLGDAGCLECPAVYSVDAEWHGGSLEDWSRYRLEHFTLGDWRCTREVAVLALGDDAECGAGASCRRVVGRDSGAAAPLGSAGGRGMSIAWDRDEALRVAEWFGRFGHDKPRQAASLLRAADAEIARLRARVEAAEKMAEALRGVVQHEASSFLGPEAERNRRASWRGALRKVKTALAAWDAGREAAE